jgi:hypothetical protein
MVTEGRSRLAAAETRCTYGVRRRHADHASCFEPSFEVAFREVGRWLRRERSADGWLHGFVPRARLSTGWLSLA